MREFRDAVQRAAGPEKVFGSDVFPPSIALLGGHLYAEWEAATDYLTGGSSFGGVVGWATTVTNVATEWGTGVMSNCARLERGSSTPNDLSDVWIWRSRTTTFDGGDSGGTTASVGDVPPRGDKTEGADQW